MNATTAYLRLTALCAQSEQCEHDIRKKMQRWELTDQEQHDILTRLVSERYIDSSRYARAFVNDKSRYNHWGAVKLRYELTRRGIPSAHIDEALELLDEEDTINTLRHLIARKRPTVRGKSEYDINAKLIRFALSRGYEMKDVMKVIKMEE